MSQPGDQESRHIDAEASFDNSSAASQDITAIELAAQDATSENTPSVQPNIKAESDQPGPPWDTCYVSDNFYRDMNIAR